MASAETKSLVTSVLASNPLRCTIKQLCDDFRNIIGSNIPIRQLGFSTVEEYLRSIPDTCTVVGFGPTAEVRGVVKEKSAHISYMVAKQKTDSIPKHKKNIIKGFRDIHQHPKPKTEFEDNYCADKIPKYVQNNLQKVIKKYDEGIWCRDLPEAYRKMFNNNLNHQKYGYKSMSEMCMSLPEVFQCIQIKSDDFLLYEKNCPAPCIGQNETAHDEEDFTIDWSCGSALIPKNIVNFLDEIPRQYIGDIENGDILDIKMGEIYSIDSFWIIPKYCRLEEDIMDKLESFLLSEGNRYLIPAVFLQEGLYCAILVNNQYHRCVVTDLLPNRLGVVKVLFIDCGSIGLVDEDKIWYLPKQFGKTPCQAIEARLANIRSASDSESVLSKFWELVTNAELKAEITNVDKERLVLELQLFNVTDNQNMVSINDALVEKGYAVYC